MGVLKRRNTYFRILKQKGESKKILKWWVQEFVNGQFKKSHGPFPSHSDAVQYMIDWRLYTSEHTSEHYHRKVDKFFREMGIDYDAGNRNRKGRR